MNWTKSMRTTVTEKLTWDNLLPSEQPIYVSSLVYSFGVFTLSSLVFTIMSGVIMAAYGPTWYQYSAAGAFFRSVHFWSVQAFFFFMTMHLVGQFFMGSWREGRAMTWVLGALSFGVSVITAFTGYLSRGDFFAQWNQVQSKDAFNGAGLDGFLNILNNGQVYGLHIAVLPLILIVLVGWHMVAVRAKGVVPPYQAVHVQKKEGEKR
ncbi:MAG: cytochrome b N-terminal domain-containing protein [Acidibacillus sp.]|uniref:Menaquinol-cytochrome c reductase cytochrome b subunit n=1 Tax=Sulfoacidibacillus ferrooxidans TaxID=2005001 RepID=A0A9X1VBE6_9BACL|nr:cytochrome b N-terminal domain-containing protein [Sulfoacidibacillus ferrooxidans]MCI0182887.1 Menaquinol-cytochrome c reductase cytochrome b subunit [Sulfoacidibacillus ferrooxidans]MCY0893539.1 cytochrome b N-terminal domain-containing protein [Acidibacillus sp.]